LESSWPLQPGGPVEYDRDRAWRRIVALRHREQKALAIGGHPVVFETTPVDERRLEHNVCDAELRPRTRSHVDRHEEFAVWRQVEQLLSVRTPLWLGAAMRRQLPAIVERRERCHVDLRCPRLVR